MKGFFMITLSVNNLSKSYGIDNIFKNVTFSLNENEKVGLVGPNGAGKSTLIKIIAGQISKDDGDIFLSKNLNIGYLEQNVRVDSEDSIYEEVLSAFSDIIELEKSMRRYEILISELSDNPAELEKAMETYSKISEEFGLKNGYAYKSETRGILIGLGFKENELDKPVKLLSGGEITALRLAKLLIKKPNVLLLDEPTNHLDMESVQWLENFLKQYRGNVIVISHDRYFLDRTVSRIFYMNNHTLKDYKGNYSEYIIKKEIEEELSEKEYKENRAEINRQKEIIRRLKAFGREKQVKRARSREKALNKIEIKEKPEHDDKSAAITFVPSVKSGDDVIDVFDLSKSFPERKLFQNVNFHIYRGEKIALIGPNGCGKTTLFNILLGKESRDTGDIKFGSNVKPSYFDQTRQDLNMQKTIIDEVWDAYPKMTETAIRNMLAAVLFMGEDVFKTISDTSGGEKARISLLKLMLSPSNFLFLDEPTNHLDITSVEVLENALIAYEGTLFFISHDRYFINKVADQVFVLTENGIEQYLGNYDYYLYKLSEKKEAENLETEQTKTVNKTDMAKRRKKDRQKESEIRTQKKRIEETEKKITELEEKIQKCDEELCKKEIYSSPELSLKTQKEKKENEDKLEQSMVLWENLINELENMK